MAVQETAYDMTDDEADLVRRALLYVANRAAACVTSSSSHIVDFTCVFTADRCKALAAKLTPGV